MNSDKGLAVLSKQACMTGIVMRCNRLAAVRSRRRTALRTALALLILACTLAGAPRDACAQAASAPVPAASAPATAPAGGANQTLPPPPPGLDSPRATIQTFIDAMNRAHAGQGEAWARALACLNTSTLEPGGGRDAANALKDVFDRVGELRPQDIPDAPAVRDQKLTGLIYTYFPRLPEHQWVHDLLKQLPAGKVALRQDGDGAWRFTPATVAGAEQLDASVADLRPGYLGEQGQLSATLGPTWQQTRWTGWLTLVIAVGAGLLAGRVARGLLHRISRRARARGRSTHATIVDNAAAPLNLLLLAAGLHAGLGAIYMTAVLADAVSRAVSLLYILTVAWFLYNLVDVVDLWMRRWRQRGSARDSLMVSLIRRVLRVVLVVIFALVAAQNVFGLNITGFLASVGIVGLAVSLAAQDSIKNMFGSITIFFDQPFAVGDYVRFGDVQGAVEAIGFRSTRLRGDDGSIVTVPNMRFIDTSVQNISARPSIYRSFEVILAPNTPAARIEQALGVVRAVLARPEVAAAFDLQDDPPRVYFATIRPEGPVLQVMYWYMLGQSRDYWAYVDHGQKVNLLLLAAMQEAALPFTCTAPAPPIGVPMVVPPGPAAAAFPRH